MATNEPAIRHELARAEERLAHATAEVRQAEAQRDSAVAKLTDLEGAHDRRPVAVR